MNLDKLVQQLRRDMAANPKKAAALGLMVLVALYFWGPLIVKWVSARTERSGKMDTANLILTDDPAEPAQQQRARGTARFRWERVQQLMRQDASMTPVAFDPTWIDPFGRGAGLLALEQSAQAADAASASEPAASTAVAPEDLALALGGVFLGAKTRVATVNGEAYREGDYLTVAGRADATAAHKVRIVEIFRQGIVIETGGRKIVLELATPALAQGDEIQRQKPPLAN